jgi:Protein of unknown function (DUF2505)
MIEKKIGAPVSKIYELLVNPNWLEKRCMDLGDLSAKVTAKKTTKGAHVQMRREMHREVSGVVGKVLHKQGTLASDETWVSIVGGYSGTMNIELVGLPVKITATFTLTADGKGSKYVIDHKPKCSVPLIGGTVERFVLGELVKGVGDELDYLAKATKK